MSSRIPVSVRSLFVIALALVSLALSSVAHAAGRVEWTSNRNFKERDDKAWRLEVAIYLPRAPDVPHVPMKFEFQPEVYYERDMVDGKDKPVEQKVPLTNHQAIIESVGRSRVFLCGTPASISGSRIDVLVVLIGT